MGGFLRYPGGGTGLGSTITRLWRPCRYSSPRALLGPDLQLQDTGVQFGGHVVSYEHNLSFVTVHGSGHMVPQFRPQSAERVLNRLLTGGLFAPVLPSDEALAAMSDSQFDTFVDQWTSKAKDSVTEPITTVII